MSRTILPITLATSLLLIPGAANGTDWIVERIDELCTPSDDGTPFVNGDTMYFFSDEGTGAQGGHDIYIATRNGGVWGNKTNVGTAINTLEHEYTPWVVGNHMYFTRGYPLPPCYLYRATVSGASWSDVVPLPGFPQSGNDFGCSLPTTENILYFASTRDGAAPYDIFTTTESGGSWDNVQPFDPLNSDLYDGCPAITPDGNTIFFARTDGSSGWDIYVSTYNGSWSTPEKLREPVNVEEYSDCYPCYVPTEGKLYFQSNRPGGNGGSDLYVATGYLSVEPASFGEVKAMFR
jgi:hypothetical protein